MQGKQVFPRKEQELICSASLRKPFITVKVRTDRRLLGNRKEAIPVLTLFDLQPTALFLPSLLSLQKPKLFLYHHFGPTESPSLD